MKKLFLLTITLLSFGQVNSQTKKNSNKTKKTEIIIYNINKADFTKSSDTTLAIQDKVFKFKAGDEKNVDVFTTIFLNKKDLDTPGIEAINFMLDMAVLKGKYEVKNKYTFVPRKIYLFKSKNNYEWTIILEYTAQNDYGATKDSKSYYLFNNDGEFLMKL